MLGAWAGVVPAVNRCVGTRFCPAGAKGPDPGLHGQYSGGSEHVCEWTRSWGRPGQFCTLSRQGTPPWGTRGQPGAFRPGAWAIYGNSWGRAPAAQNVCSPFAAQGPSGPVPRPGQACLPQQDGGQLPGLDGGLAWVLGGAGARARGRFPASSWEEMKTPEK